MVGRASRTLLAAVLATAALVPLVAPAAASGPTADETLTADADGARDLAMAPNGYAIAAWVERPPSGPLVRVALRPPGGPWSTPQALPVALDSVSDLDVAVASNGAAAVTWTESRSPSTFQVALATRVPGSAFGTPELLTDGRQTRGPAVGIDAGGSVTLLYNPDSTIVVRELQAGSPALAAARATLSTDCSAIGQRLAVAPSGSAVAGYDCGGAVFALRRGGRWAVSPKVADSFPGGACPSTTDRSTPSVAIDSAGNAVGLLQTTLTQRIDLGVLGCQTSSTTVSVTLALPLGGVMTPVVGPVVSATAVAELGFSALPVVGPSAVVSPAGIAVAWAERAALLAPAEIKARFYALDGSAVGAPQTVGTAGAAGVSPSLAVMDDGRTLLAWPRFDEPEGVAVLAAERPPGGAFGLPLPVSGSGAPASGPQVAAGVGDAAITWIRNRAAPYELHVRGWDASPPMLGVLNVPQTAIVGRPVALSVAPFDVWGPVAVRWELGDGATATGAAVQHAYRAPGDYGVSVTATDAVGLSRMLSATVRVRAAAAAGAPVLTRASVRPRRFRVGRRATAVRAVGRAAAVRRRRKAPVGATFRFTLDRAATVTLAFARQAPGKRAGRRCVRPVRRLARARRCVRWQPAGKLVRRAGRGATVVPFSGRVGRRALRPGAYRATLTPRANGRAGKPRTLTFTVVR